MLGLLSRLRDIVHHFESGWSKKPFSKEASFYLSDAEIFFYTASWTKEGVLIASGPLSRMSIPEFKAQCTKFVLSCLKKSKSPVPHPRDWKAQSAFYNKMLTEAGIRRKSDLNGKFKSLGLSLEANKITIMSGISGGYNKGYSYPKEGRIVLPASCTNEELYAAMSLAWERC